MSVLKLMTLSVITLILGSTLLTACGAFKADRTDKEEAQRQAIFLASQMAGKGACMALAPKDDAVRVRVAAGLKVAEGKLSAGAPPEEIAADLKLAFQDATAASFVDDGFALIDVLLPLVNDDASQAGKDIVGRLIVGCKIGLALKS